MKERKKERKIKRAGKAPNIRSLIQLNEFERKF